MLPLQRQAWGDETLKPGCQAVLYLVQESNLHKESSAQHSDSQGVDVLLASVKAAPTWLGSMFAWLDLLRALLQAISLYRACTLGNNSTQSLFCLLNAAWRFISPGRDNVYLLLGTCLWHPCVPGAVHGHSFDSLNLVQRKSVREPGGQLLSWVSYVMFVLCDLERKDTFSLWNLNKQSCLCWVVMLLKMKVLHHWSQIRAFSAADLWLNEQILKKTPWRHLPIFQNKFSS